MSKFKLYVTAFFMLYLTSSDAVVKQSTMQARIVVVDYCSTNKNNTEITVVCKGNSPFALNNRDANRIYVTY